MRKWPQDGLPPPRRLDQHEARNHAIDRLRREARGHTLLRPLATLRASGSEHIAEEADQMVDDRLRLIFSRRLEREIRSGRSRPFVAHSTPHLIEAIAGTPGPRAADRPVMPPRESVAVAGETLLTPAARTDRSL